jgi:hypothetical protein
VRCTSWRSIWREYLIKAESWSYSSITSPDCGIVDLPTISLWRFMNFWNCFWTPAGWQAQAVTNRVERSKSGFAGSQLVRCSRSRAVWAGKNRFDFRFRRMQCELCIDSPVAIQSSSFSFYQVLTASSTAIHPIPLAQTTVVLLIRNSSRNMHLRSPTLKWQYFSFFILKHRYYSFRIQQLEIISIAPARMGH